MGCEIYYFFRFAVDDLQTIKADNIEGTILDWQQKESKIPNELEQQAV